MTTISDQPRTLWPRRGLSAVLDFLAASHARIVIALVLICLAGYLPGFFNIPPVDRDEARFVQATKQMIETGDYVDIRFQDEVRYKKPVGLYWLQAAAVRAAELVGANDPRTSIWLYRLPSLIGAVGGVLLTYWTALAFGSRRMAYLAALMLATSILLNVEVRLATTDAMLLLTVVAAMGVFARVYLAQEATSRWVLPGIFWTALAGGVLLKGPLILMVVVLAGASLAIIDRSARWLSRLRPALGLVWLLILVLPWFVAILSRTGLSFFVLSFGNDFLGKVAAGQESHGGPPGLYLLLFWFTFWPAAPIAALAVPAVWRDRWEPSTKFLLAWLVPSWIVFELVITKLPHYVLPLYPAIAILSARVVDVGALSENRHLVRLTGLWPILAAILSITGIVGVIMLRRQLALPSWPFAAIAFIFALLAWQLYDADGAERSLLRASLAGQLVVIAILGAMVPLMRPLFPSALLARSIVIDCDQPLFAAAGYYEPSLVFLFGTQTRLGTAQGAADFLAEGSCRFAMIEGRSERAFVQRAEAIGLRYAAGPRIDAINHSSGRAITIAVYRSEAAP